MTIITEIIITTIHEIHDEMHTIEPTHSRTNEIHGEMNIVTTPTNITMRQQHPTALVITNPTNQANAKPTHEV